MIERIIKLINAFIYELYLTVGFIVSIIALIYLIGYFMVYAF